MSAKQIREYSYINLPDPSDPSKYKNARFRARTANKSR